MVAWLRGEFDAAGSHLEPATAGLAAADQHQIDAVWFQPNDPIASAYIHLALTRLVRGDLTGAEAELAQAARRAEQLGFPQGPFSLAYARFVEIWLRIEAGQLDRAAVLAADLIDQAERHGFDLWRLVGATQQAIVSALAALGADDLDPTRLSAHIATMTTLLDTLRTVGLNIYRHLLRRHARAAVDRRRPTRAGPRPPGHRTALAQDTGMCFYDAELLRLRAHTHTDPTPAEPTSAPPSTSPAARARPYSNCAPPSTISSSAANPRAPPSSTPSAASPPTARLRNWREPKHYFRELTRTMQVGRKPDRHSY